MKERKQSIVLICIGIPLFLIGTIGLIFILIGFGFINLLGVIWVGGWFFGATLFLSGISKLVDTSGSIQD